MTRAGRTGTPSRLFAVYAGLSAVPVIALGLVLDSTYRAAAQQQGLAQGRAQAAVIEEMAVSPALSGDDLELGLSRAERDRLSAATDLAVYKGSVLRLRLRGFDGSVVFTDDGRDGAVSPTRTAAFQAAAVGHTTAQVVQHGKGSAVLVVRPVVASASGRSTGVLELLLPYDGIAAAIEKQVRASWLRLLVGLCLLYAVLAGLSWTTSLKLRRHAAQREHEALHDSLTGLPNRSLFQERAHTAAAAATPAQPAALVLVDLDRFKHVNDTLGHHAGDELLRVVAHRLAAALRTDDTVARLGGDEFGLVLPGIVDEATALALLEQVRVSLAEELQLEGVTLSIEASMGVALAPQHGDDVETLLKRADAAMYRGKRGTSSVVLADVAAPSDTATSLSIHSEVRRALDRDEFVLHYQPKVDLRTGDVVGLEALVRWQHPERGLLPPGAFLPTVEVSDAVEPFTDWVVERALRDLQHWQSAGHAWSVSVNVSARNLDTPGFSHRLAARLGAASITPGRFVVEITETSLAADADTAAACVAELAAYGIPVSVDDFGTGWSSLTQLRVLPVTEVKIDRSFVTNLETDVQDRALVRSVIALAHGLACRVVAEGVESAATAAWLRENGCDQAQGYFWSRPVPWQSLASRDTPLPAIPAVPALPVPRGAVLTSAKEAS